MNLNVPPEESLEAAGAMIESYAPGDKVPQVQAPLATVSAASLAGCPVPQRQFLDDAHLIPMRNVTMLSGDGGTGKSLLALQLAAAVAGGTQWIGMTVRPGSALYLSAEDDMAELHARLAWICESEAMGIETFQRLHLADLTGHDAVLAQEADGATKMKATPLFCQLKARIGALRPKVVVIDNLADVFAGNENARPLARQFVSQLRSLAVAGECAVLLLSHPSLSGMNSGSGASGSTAWNNSVRSRLYLRRDGDGSAGDPDGRMLETMKANYGPSGGKIELRWEAGRFVRQIGPGGGAFDEAARHLQAERVFLDLLEWHHARKIRVSPHRSKVAVDDRNHRERSVYMKIKTIGLDLAKSVFQVHGIDDDGRVLVVKRLRRKRVIGFFSKLPGCLIGIEACATAHYWARALAALGHEVKLMPPAYVGACVKRGKNDAADAEAICEAVQRRTMRFVPVKTPEQQGILIVHRTRADRSPAHDGGERVAGWRSSGWSAIPASGTSSSSPLLSLTKASSSTHFPRWHR